MTGEIDPFEFLDEVPSHMEDAVKNPDNFNFRSDEYEENVLYPDHPNIRATVVDLKNNNVSLHYNTHTSQEKYVTVAMEENFSIVESTKQVNIDNRRTESTLYYLVTEDEVFLHDNGYEESLNTRLQEVSDLSREFYQQALEADQTKDKKENHIDQGPDPVPPPEKNEMFPE